MLTINLILLLLIGYLLMSTRQPIRKSLYSKIEGHFISVISKITGIERDLFDLKNWNMSERLDLLTKVIGEQVLYRELLGYSYDKKLDFQKSNNSVMYIHRRKVLFTPSSNVIAADMNAYIAIKHYGDIKSLKLFVFVEEPKVIWKGWRVMILVKILKIQYLRLKTLVQKHGQPKEWQNLK